MKCLNCLSPWSRLAAIGSIAFGLSACGDEVTEQIYTNLGAVESSKDLPECTKEIAGQTAFISETHEFLGCDGKEWMARVPGLRRQGMDGARREHGERGRQRLYLHELERRHGFRDFL